jgi:hypothetical protein
VNASSLKIEEAQKPSALDGWTALGHGAGFYTSERWHTYADAASGASSRYLLASRGTSPLAALSTHETMDGGFGEEYDPVELLGPDAGITADDIVLFGGYRGYRSDVLREQTEAGTEALAALLVEAARGREWWWPYLSGDDALVVLGAARMASGLGSLHFVGADSSVAVAGSFEDHLASLRPKQRRTNARRELARAEGLGLSVQVLPLQEVRGRLVPLLAQVQAKYGQNADPESLNRLLKLQTEYLSDLALVFACVNASAEIVGFSLYYRSRGRMSLRIVGFDYSRLQADEYALVALHEPIRYATENGIEQVHLGIDSSAAKVRRGARPMALWAVTSHGPRDDARNRHRAAVFAESLPAHEAASFSAEVDSVLARQ